MSPPQERNVLRWIALGTILFLVGVVIVVAISQGRGGDGGPDSVVGATPSPSPEATATPTPTPTEVSLPDIEGIPKRGTAVLIVVERDACWRGYVGGTKIQGCGPKRINLTAVPNRIKAGAQLKPRESSSLLEVYIVHQGVGVASSEAAAPGELVEVRGTLSG